MSTIKGWSIQLCSRRRIGQNLQVLRRPPGQLLDRRNSTCISTYTTVWESQPPTGAIVLLWCLFTALSAPVICGPQWPRRQRSSPGCQTERGTLAFCHRKGVPVAGASFELQYGLVRGGWFPKEPSSGSWNPCRLRFTAEAPGQQMSTSGLLQTVEGGAGPRSEKPGQMELEVTGTDVAVDGYPGNLPRFPALPDLRGLLCLQAV